MLCIEKHVLVSISALHISAPNLHIYLVREHVNRLAYDIAQKKTMAEQLDFSSIFYLNKKFELVHHLLHENST